MGWPRCCVENCWENKKQRFRFPHPYYDDNMRFAEWLKMIGDAKLNALDPMVVYRNKRVCFRHFNITCFDAAEDTVRLKRNAIPTRFPRKPLNVVVEESTAARVFVNHDDCNAVAATTRDDGGSSAMDSGNSRQGRASQQQIDTRRCDSSLMAPKTDRKNFTTEDLIGSGRRVKDGLNLQASSEFYSSSFGDIPTLCSVQECVVAAAVPSTDKEVPLSSTDGTEVASSRLTDLTTTPVIPFKRPSVNPPVGRPPVRVVWIAPKGKRVDSTCTIPVTMIPLSLSSVTEKREGRGNSTSRSSVDAVPQKESSSALTPSGQRVDPPELEGDDSSCDNMSIFSVEPPRASPPPHGAGVIDDTDMINVELLAKSFFAGAGGDTLVYLSDPYYRYKLCRLCFRAGKELTCIFGENFKEFDLRSAIEDLVQFKVSKTDDYPQQICERCLPKLVRFKHFKDQFLKDKELFDEELRKYDKKVDVGSEQTSSQAAQVDEPMPESSILDHQYSVREDEAGMAASEEQLPSASQAVEDEAISGDKHVEQQEGFDSDFQGVESSSEEEEEEGGASDDVELGKGATPSRVVPEEAEEKARRRKAQLDGLFPCIHCTEVFEYQNHKDAHMKEHEKTFPFACTDCDRRFLTLVNLNTHIVRHSDYKPYQCEECGLRCRLASTLVQHKANMHSGDDLCRHLCPLCGRGFKNAISFRRHTLRCHLDKKPFACDVCHKEFAMGHSLRAHMGTHSGVKPFLCGACGKAFSSTNCLRRHEKRLHDPRPGQPEWRCDVCGRGFICRDYLTEHRRWHFQKRPPRIRRGKQQSVEN